MRVTPSILFYGKYFFFNDTATTEIYTLSLHDALPILPPQDGHAAPSRWPHYRLVSFSVAARRPRSHAVQQLKTRPIDSAAIETDRKSTRLNSSHGYISYAVFCLKKKMIFLITTIAHFL